VKSGVFSESDSVLAAVVAGGGIPRMAVRAARSCTMNAMLT